jgi:hypothetical protein
MHPRILWLVVGAVTVFAAQAAVIYKWTDADGVVHYSDQAEPGAEKIFTTSAVSNGTTPPRTASGPQPPKKPPPPPAMKFTQFAITSPAREQTFFGDDVIGVHLDLAPELRSDQSISWRLNGRQLTDQLDVTQFTLPHLDRGAYSIVATVTDQRSGETQSTEGINFYVRQPSALAPLRKSQ